MKLLSAESPSSTNQQNRPSTILRRARTTELEVALGAARSQIEGLEAQVVGVRRELAEALAAQAASSSAAREQVQALMAEAQALRQQTLDAQAAAREQQGRAQAAQQQVESLQAAARKAAAQGQAQASEQEQLQAARIRAAAEAQERTASMQLPALMAQLADVQGRLEEVGGGRGRWKVGRAYITG